ncbi:MAG TPA: PrsW family glutamic-type intramembrane protease [Candidatus Paceibacterota bacterium]
MTEIFPFVIAIAGGIFPALAWLWFWLREDSEHPEPRYLIALAFLAGMISVAVVIPIQKFAAGFLTGTVIIFTAWSVIEEVVKYLAARLTVLRRREDDEPIDPVIYMVTVALGFAAIENTLFLLSPLAGNTLVETVMTGNLRFLGATLLHVLSSAVVGVAIALSFYRGERARIHFAWIGVILAALLHSTFNFLILTVSEEHLLRTFSLVWIGVIVLLAVLEYVKRIHPVRNRRSLTGST